MAPSYNRSRGRSGRNNRHSSFDHYIVEGLPIRHWRRDNVTVAPLPRPDLMAHQNDKWAIELPYGMPKDTHLLPVHSQELLRATRSGRLYYKRIVPVLDDEMESADIAGEKIEKSEKEKEIEVKRFTARTWKQLPKHLEGPDLVYLAARRKGLINSSKGPIKAGAPNPVLTKAIVKRTDASGNIIVEDMVLKEGDYVLNGEILTQKIIPHPVVPEPPAAPATPVRKNPPLAKRKAKGSGRGRRKNVQIVEVGKGAAVAAPITKQKIAETRKQKKAATRKQKRAVPKKNDKTKPLSNVGNEDTEMGDEEENQSDNDEFVEKGDGNGYGRTLNRTKKRTLRRKAPIKKLQTPILPPQPKRPQSKRLQSKRPQPESPQSESSQSEPPLVRPAHVKTSLIKLPLPKEILAKLPQTKPPPAKTTLIKLPLRKEILAKLPQSTPPQTKPPQTKPPQTKPPQTKPPQTKPPQTKPPQTKPPQTKPPQRKPPQAKPSQAKPPQAKSSQAKPSPAKPSQAKPSQAKPSQAKPPQAKTSLVKLPLPKQLLAKLPQTKPPQPKLPQGKFLRARHQFTTEQSLVSVGLNATSVSVPSPLSQFSVPSPTTEEDLIMQEALSPPAPAPPTVQRPEIMTTSIPNIRVEEYPHAPMTAQEEHGDIMLLDTDLFNTQEEHQPMQSITSATEYNTQQAFEVPEEFQPAEQTVIGRGDGDDGFFDLLGFGGNLDRNDVWKVDTNTQDEMMGDVSALPAFPSASVAEEFLSVSESESALEDARMDPEPELAFWADPEVGVANPEPEPVNESASEQSVIFLAPVVEHALPAKPVAAKPI